jgi:hypothetical protein
MTQRPIVQRPCAAMTGLLLAAFVPYARGQGSQGPDVFVYEIPSAVYLGVVDGINAYGVGTNACNAGDAPVNWYASDSRHPVIAQNMYRLQNGRFEQIGQSWAKHGFGSSNFSVCGTCQLPPDGRSQLGVGCSDPYTANRNGTQSTLGPRSQINATTGVFPYPFTAPPAPATIGRRLQVATADVDPALNPATLFFVEGRYVAADDAQANNGLNNASYQRVTITSTTAAPVPIGSTHQAIPALRAWRDNDPAVTVLTADYQDTSLPGVSITARFWIGYKVSSNIDGTWHYEYAVYNHNADRAAGSFSISIPAGVVVTNIGFHAVACHSGEIYDNTPWTGANGTGAVTWTVPQTYAQNQNASALRWGTLYNFRFDANAGPAPGTASLGLFKPGMPTALPVAVSIPGAPSGCSVDTNGDGHVDIQDFLAFLQLYATGDPRSDFNRDQQVNLQDFLAYLSAFAAGC